MPFLTTRPTSRMRPIADETLRSVPVGESNGRRRPTTAAPPRGSGRRGRHGTGRPGSRTPATRQPNTIAARGTPAAATRTGRRPRRCSRPATAGLEPRAISATALPRSRSSSRAGHERHLAQVLAQQLGLAVGARRVGERRDRHEPPSAADGQPARRAGSKRSGRSGRAPARERSSSRRSVATTPSQAAESWPATCSTVSPTRPAASGSTCQVDLRVAALHADHVDHARRLRQPRLDAPASSASSAGSSPKILTSMGSGALEVAEHVLQELDELDLVPGQRPRQAGAQVRHDLVGRAIASPRGLRRTRMSPLFCCGGEQTESEPVRRENAATSGVAARIASICAPGGRSPRAPCRPASGSR